jgi:hypothetical protein
VTRVLFLGGLGRSGTTLVERLLAELPGVVALGEVVHLWQRDLRDGERCGCGDPFVRCRFWSAVGRLAFGGWQQVDVDRVLHLQARVERTRWIPRLAATGRSASTRPADLTEYLDYYRRIYLAAARLTGAQLVIDSSKHSALAWCLSRLELDLRVAHVVRDPRAVAYSWTKSLIRPESRGDRMTRYPPSRSALLWSTHNVALDLLARSGVPVRRVRYEQLLADPHGQLRALAAYAGLAPTAADLDFLGDGQAILRTSHSAAGNPMRFITGPVPLRRDDDWRARLPRRHRRLVGALCAPLLAAYGYPLSGRSFALHTDAQPLAPQVGTHRGSALHTDTQPLAPHVGTHRGSALHTDTHRAVT